MLGAIVGDIVGSRFEFDNHKSKEFDLFTNKNFFTDDSVLTLAIAKTFNELNKDDKDFRKRLIENMQSIGKQYPYAGYGLKFRKWLYQEDPEPYQSLGNGSAMRVSPVAYMADSLEECEALAKLTAEVSHDHPEGIKGAQATASAIYLALQGADKEEIKDLIKERYYDVDFGNSFTLDLIRPTYSFYETCPGSVPEAFEAFFEGEDFEDVIRNAVSIGGDSDTIAAIAGSIAGAYYGIPEEIATTSKLFLDSTLASILEDFETKKDQD